MQQDFFYYLVVDIQRICIFVVIKAIAFNFIKLNYAKNYFLTFC